MKRVDVSIYVHEREKKKRFSSFKTLHVRVRPQISVRAQEAKIIEEKAAKIKDWVTVKLKEVSSQPAMDHCC